MEEVISEDEAGFITETIKSRDIPTPKLLIKDHKTMKPDGSFPTRLVVPATNFTAAFPKVGYIGIKSIFDKNEIVYDRTTIIQASDLKGKLEKLNLKQNEVTIASIDAVDMYPSIKYKLVVQAVNFFARDLSDDDKQSIKNCMDMIKFGMGNTLLTFIDQYYEYGGDMEQDDRGLTIGGYESAWLADLVAAYILEKTNDECFSETLFNGIYRDNGLVVLNGNWSKQDVVQWLEQFQKKIDDIAGSHFLKFTAVVWGMEKDDGTVSEAITVANSTFFPYLDMELYWTDQDL